MYEVSIGTQFEDNSFKCCFDQYIDFGVALGKVYTAGKSLYGHLAQGDVKVSKSFTKVVEPKEILNRRFVDIGTGHASMAVLTDSGKVYFCGTCGSTHLSHLTPITFPEKIVQIAAGSTFHLAVGESRTVYSYGTDSYGALGRDLLPGIGESWTPTPVQLNPKLSVVKVTCGFGHSVALTAEGEIYAWGLGTSYQLGTGLDHGTKVPTKVVTPAGVAWKDIAAGYYHSAALTIDNEVYTWGNNSDGALGIPWIEGNECARFPTRSETPFKAQMIACGLYHTSAIDLDGKLWSTGLNNSGQLGVGDFINRRTWTKAIGVDSLKFIFLNCGWVMTFVITNKYELYSCGRDLSGELGHQAVSSKNVLTQVVDPPNVKWAKVSGGCYASGALSKATS